MAGLYGRLCLVSSCQAVFQSDRTILCSRNSARILVGCKWVTFSLACGVVSLKILSSLMGVSYGLDLAFL